MKKIIIIALLSGSIGMNAMEQLEYDTYKKQEDEEISIAAKNEDNQIEQCDQDNIQIIDALDLAWKNLSPALSKGYSVLERLSTGETVLTSIPELNNVRILLNQKDPKRRACWYNIIKISLTKNLLHHTECNCYSFSADLEAYVHDQISGKYDPDEQLDDWLQEIFRLYKK